MFCKIKVYKCQLYFSLFLGGGDELGEDKTETGKECTSRPPSPNLYKEALGRLSHPHQLHDTRCVDDNVSIVANVQLVLFT